MSKKGTALITGGAIRIGKAIALALAEDGYDIALHYNSSEAEAEKTAADIKKIGRKCIIFQEDLNDFSQIERLLDDVKKSFGRINLLVNNASVFEKHNFAKTDEEVFNRHMNINFKAPFFLSQGFALKGNKGQIINILDTYITKNATKRFAYILSKKALHELTLMSAKELGPRVRVNALAIGTTEISKDIPRGYLEQKKKELPMSEIVTISQVTDALIGLVNSNGLTGQVVFVDSGEHLVS